MAPTPTSTLLALSPLLPSRNATALTLAPPAPTPRALLGQSLPPHPLLGRAPIGTNICLTAMEGFECDGSTGIYYRCAGDGYHYCICAPLANRPSTDPEGLFLDSAWDLSPGGCSACRGLERGALTDGTCFGNGNTPPDADDDGYYTSGRPHYVATVTKVVVAGGAAPSSPSRTTVTTTVGGAPLRLPLALFAWSAVLVARCALSAL